MGITGRHFKHCIKISCWSLLLTTFLNIRVPLALCSRSPNMHVIYRKTKDFNSLAQSLTHCFSKHVCVAKHVCRCLDLYSYTCFTTFILIQSIYLRITMLTPTKLCISDGKKRNYLPDRSTSCSMMKNKNDHSIWKYLTIFFSFWYGLRMLF